MGQQMTAEETVQFLSDYREATHNLYQLLSKSTVEELELDRLTDLLSERDRLIERFGESTPDLTGAGVETMLAEIQQMDTTVSNFLRALLTGTQLKISGVQEQKRGASAYHNDYTANAIYFDRRK